MQSLDDLEAEMKRTLAPPNEDWRWSRSTHLPDFKEWREYRNAWRWTEAFVDCPLCASS